MRETTDRWNFAFWHSIAAARESTAPLRPGDATRARMGNHRGIDGGGLDDLLGLGLIGREIGTGRWLHWERAWAHPSVLERRKEIAPRLRDFEQDKDLVIVNKIGEDVAELAQIIRRIYDAGLFPEKEGVGADPSGITFAEAFAEAEIPETLLVGVSQGWRMGGTIKTVGQHER